MPFGLEIDGRAIGASSEASVDRHAGRPSGRSSMPRASRMPDLRSSTDSMSTSRPERSTRSCADVGPAAGSIAGLPSGLPAASASAGCGDPDVGRRTALSRQGEGPARRRQAADRRAASSSCPTKDGRRVRAARSGRTAPSRSRPASRRRGARGRLQGPDRVRRSTSRREPQAGEARRDAAVPAEVRRRGRPPDLTATVKPGDNDLEPFKLVRSRATASAARRWSPRLDRSSDSATPSIPVLAMFSVDSTCILLSRECFHEISIRDRPSIAAASR